MSKLRPIGIHTHTCANFKYGCINRVECSNAFLERNYYRYPEVYCRFNELESLLCEECEESNSCEVCGVPDHLLHDDDCSYWEREHPLYEVPIEVYDDDNYY